MGCAGNDARGSGGSRTVGSPTRRCIGRESNAKSSLDIKELIPPAGATANNLQILYGYRA